MNKRKEHNFTQGRGKKGSQSCRQIETKFFCFNDVNFEMLLTDDEQLLLRRDAGTSN